MAGIVRKIDELGRIVIPKEIRKVLRIKDGEALEIHCQKDGIFLKKYSEMKDFQELAKKYLEILSRYVPYDILISDRDCYFTGNGFMKKQYIGKPIGPFLEHMIEHRENVLKLEGNVEITKGSFETGNILVLPIHEGGNILGCCVVFFKDDYISQDKENLLHFTMDLLAKHIEE